MQYAQLKNLPNVTINDIYTGNGVSELINLSMQALLDEGDEILIPSPDYPLWTATATLAGGKVVHYICDEQAEWYPDMDDIKKKITDRTKAIVLINPNNPTGALYPKEVLMEIVKIARDHQLIIFSDEIYDRLVMDGEEHVSIASLPGMKERTIVINGFSKTYAMTGWRMGYAAGPKEIISPMTKLHQYGIMSAPTMSQYAAIEALKNGDDDIAEMRDQYDMRRRLIVDGLNRLGLTCFEPEGAFYVFPSIQSTGMTSDEFCERLIYDKHVAVVPGSAFGACGEGFVRISYAYSIKHLAEALNRIGAFLKELK